MRPYGYEVGRAVRDMCLIRKKEIDNIYEVAIAGQDGITKVGIHPKEGYPIRKHYDYLWDKSITSVNVY